MIHNRLKLLNLFFGQALRENNLKQEDEIIMSVDDKGKRIITSKKKYTVADGPLALKGTWKVIKL